MDLKKHIPQEWIREKIRQYEFLRRLRDDDKLRQKWAKQRIKSLSKQTNISEEDAEDIVQTFLDQLDFLTKINADGKPSIHITPKKVRGHHYSKILGIPSSNLNSALNRLINQAAQDILRGYGKGAILTSIFGQNFGTKFNKYIIQRMEHEFGK